MVRTVVEKDPTTPFGSWHAEGCACAPVCSQCTRHLDKLPRYAASATIVLVTNRWCLTLRSIVDGSTQPIDVVLIRHLRVCQNLAHKQRDANLVDSGVGVWGNDCASREVDSLAYK
jgi:hypothetical protein